MTSYPAAFERVETWTEDDFLDLPDDGPRFELFHGSLVVSPLASKPHQRLGLRVVFELDSVVPPHLEVFGEINVRVNPSTVFRPDLVITDNPGDDDRAADATNVVLVGEITSPANSGMDRFVKPQAYAAAGIRYYLRIDLAESIGAPGAVLYGLHEGRYRELAVAAPGEMLVMTEPFPVELDLAALARRTRPPR